MSPVSILYRGRGCDSLCDESWVLSNVSDWHTILSTQDSERSGYFFSLSVGTLVSDELLFDFWVFGAAYGMRQNP